MSRERERDRDRDRDKARSEDRVDKLRDRVTELEDKLNRETNFRVDLAQNVETVARLGVYTARAVQEVQSRYKVVGFVTGEVKQDLARSFKALQEEARKRRAEKKARDERRDEEELLQAEGEQASSAAAAAPERRQDWRHVFFQRVGFHLEETAEQKKLKEKLQYSLEVLKSVSVDRSVDFVRMEPREAPEGNGSWCATVSFKDTTDGQTLRTALVEELRPLYGRPSSLAFRPDGANGKDRPLTAEVAGLAKLEVRTGKPKARPDERKRRSPEPGRASKSKKERR